MTKTSAIRTDFREDVATIELDSPETLGAVTPEMLRRIPEFLNEAADREARVVLISGAGRAFCSGAALGSVSNQRDLGQVVSEFYNPLGSQSSGVSFADRQCGQRGGGWGWCVTRSRSGHHYRRTFRILYSWVFRKLGSFPTQDAPGS
jgi:hypothetical protein